MFPKWTVSVEIELLLESPDHVLDVPNGEHGPGNAIRRQVVADYLEYLATIAAAVKFRVPNDFEHRQERNARHFAQALRGRPQDQAD